MAINPALLAPGVKAPTWTTNLVRPAGHPNALWAGANNPGAGWTGVGAGWWVPPKSSIGTTASSTRPATTKTTTPAQTPGTSATTTASAISPSAPSPLDTQYWQSVGANDQATIDKIVGYQNQQTQANIGLQNTQTAYAHQQPLDVLAAQIAANRRGGLWSASLAQQIGNIGSSYLTKNAAAQTTHDNAITNLANLITQAKDAGDQYDLGQYWDAVGRAANAAASDTSLGATPPPAATTPASTPAATHVRPAGAPANARWAGPNKPGPNWRGIGGGWWVPK